MIFRLQFKLPIKIGSRNISRNKRRSLITILAIAFVTIALVFFVSLQLSAYDTSIAVSTSVMHGNLQVQKKDHLKESDISLRFSEKINLSGSLSDQISRLEGVVSVSPRAEAFGLFSSKDRTYAGKILGVDVDREKNVSTIPTVIKSGRFIASGPELVLGSHFANNLKIDVGSEVTMLAQGEKGEVVAEIFTVVGIFESGLREIDTALIEVPLSYFQNAFNIGDSIHSIVIKTDRIDNTDSIKKSVDDLIRESRLEDIIVYTWQDLVPGLKQMIQMDMAIGSVFYLTLLLVVVFTLLNTFIMSILERKKEFAVMRALGASTQSIGLMVVTEGFVLTLIGVACGIILGACLVYYFSIVGFQIPGSEEIGRRMNLQTIVYPWVSLRSLVVGPSLLIILSLLALISPAREPKRIHPSEVLRT